MPPNQTPQFPQQPSNGQTSGAPVGPMIQPLPPNGPALAPGKPIQQAQTARPIQPKQAQANNVQPPTKRNPNSTQNALLLSEIRDNLAIMNDGSMRAVVTCRSINFDLMSSREREAVEYSYQNFLNSLYFPIQVLIRSQRVDIGPYLDKLVKLRREQDNMLLGVLMEDYIDFISAISQETNIMDKSFFIVVPYYPSGNMDSAVNTSKNLLSNLFAPQSQQRIRIDEATFNKAKDELRNRVSTVINGLMQIGIHSTALSTKELGELYYNVYNPDTAVRQPLGNFEALTASVITKGQGEAPKSNLQGGF
ncbi:MAG: hypothetical protein PVI21_02720 [Candidatus Woesebacteria bacterium]|jgi:hypothetical protein